jgi:hypothetical protein
MQYRLHRKVFLDAVSKLQVGHFPLKDVDLLVSSISQQIKIV